MAFRLQDTSGIIFGIPHFKKNWLLGEKSKKQSQKDKFKTENTNVSIQDFDFEVYLNLDLSVQKEGFIQGI